MANTKKIKEIDFEKELTSNIYVTYKDSYLIHRRMDIIRVSWGKTYCNIKSRDLSSYYKKGIQLSDICKECLRSYSTDEIEALKHFLVVQKLKGR